MSLLRDKCEIVYKIRQYFHVYILIDTLNVIIKHLMIINLS